MDFDITDPTEGLKFDKLSSDLDRMDRALLAMDTSLALLSAASGTMDPFQ